MSRAAFYVLFTASGFAGLIYESIWTHYLKLFLGHAAYAQSLVLVVFMGGMAGGAALCGRLSSRLPQPLLGYALVEAAIGLLALVFHWVFVAATDWAYASMLPAVGGGAALAAKLTLSCVLILPQSVLLGATFPLMSAGLARAFPASAGESVAMLYFTNSLGAAAGVLASGFWLIAWIGLPGTLDIAGVLNLLLALTVWLLSRSLYCAPLERTATEEAGAKLLLAVAFFTGLASFIYEIVWIRMLSLVLGASTHSFELMLAAFILGLALGGLAIRRSVDRAASPERLLGWVQVAMALAAAATLPVYDFTFGLMEALMTGLARNDTGYALFNLSGAGIALLVMLPATFCAGMTLPLITGAALRRGAGESAIGRVYAANTLGSIVGVVLAVHIGLPQLGLKFTLLAGCLVDAALGIALLALFGSNRAWKAATAAGGFALLAIGIGVQLDPHKMTAGVFRHGELAASRDAKILFAKDGKTATVHLVQYSEATSLRTNGKSDGSIVMDRDAPRGSDEVTMVLTAGIPLALNPDTRRAAVIGIGTGLTTHTLLESLSIEHVDTVEIEAAMAEASRGFMPRNSGTYADPRGTLVIDDAKSYFSASGARYDLIISEPSNPWVSGVASLFTREFYRRIRGHLEPGGMLVQWFQLYEIDASLVASVMTALAEEFPHYAIFAPSDHDILIVAGDRPLPLPAQARVFEQPGLAKELWTVHVLTAGDLDARYIGSRELLAPLFASYGVPANSDYEPLLDLNAARHRFTERSATDLVALLNLDVPVLEMLDPSRSRRAINPLFQGAYAFDRIENARLAWYARDFLIGARQPAPERVPTALQKDLDLLRVRLLECRDPRNYDVWLHSAVRVAALVNPHLSPDDAGAIWARVQAGACYPSLNGLQREWIGLLRAVAARDAARMAPIAEDILAREPGLAIEAREYLLMAAMTARLASREPDAALRLWQEHGARVRTSSPVFRLLRCRARSEGCAADFTAYAVE